MSKGLEALERIKSHYNDKVCIDVLDDFDIIENALKRLAVYETFDLLDEKDDVDKLTDIKGKLTYVDKVMDTQERLLSSVSSDEIRILNSVFKSQLAKLRKKLKALEIIKEKICLGGLCSALQETKNFEDYKVSYFTQLTKEEYDLLKEVLV